MCTVSWWREPDSYTVFFNRDELKTRSRALPPTIQQQNGVRYIAPTDADGGGTWLGSKQIEFVYQPDAPCREAECTFVAMRSGS
jgi:hypothetical protein